MDTITEKIDQKKQRLALYYQKETEILTNGIQAYGLGSRSVTRYNADLTNIRSQIKELETEINELEIRQSGIRPRKAFAVVPRDF